MLFHSTRGEDIKKDFSSILMQGLASDGGLFMPDHWPQIDLDKIKNTSSFLEIAELIVPHFTSSSFSKKETINILKKTWHDFEHQDFVGLETFGNISVLELFHGPTAAFKDFGLQLSAAFFNEVLEKENKTAIVLGATSGDTGSAAIDACKQFSRIKTFILLPNGNMSEIQRRQMSTIKSDNVFALRVDGTFDDCQDMVKLAFNKRDFLNENQYLLAVNSINWMRIVGQICYYFYAFIALKYPEDLRFSIPTGNFGNVFAAYSAYKMGLPIKEIKVAVNSNDILFRFFDQNDYSKFDVNETISPSMDISVASNFERLVYDFFLDRNSQALQEMFSNFPNQPLNLKKNTWQKGKALFSSIRVNDQQTKSRIIEFYAKNQYLLDPHTAVAADLVEDNHDYIILATAHPAKFPQLYAELNLDIGKVPRSLKHLSQLDENLHFIRGDYSALASYIHNNN